MECNVIVLSELVLSCSKEHCIFAIPGLVGVKRDTSASLVNIIGVLRLSGFPKRHEETRALVSVGYSPINISS